MQAGINFALKTADMLVQNGDKRAEVERDIRAIDMSQDGQLTDWFKSMGTVDARTRCLAGDLAYGGGQMQTHLSSLAAAMTYLQTSGRLTGIGDGTPMPGLGPRPGTGSGVGKRPMQAAGSSGRVVQGGRVRVEPRPRQPPPREVSEPRPRQPRYRSSRADNAKEQHSERKGGKATPMELRPAVRVLTLPGEGRAPGRDVRRKHLSQEDYERRDSMPVKMGITYGEGVGGRIFSAIASCAKLGSVTQARQHDRALDVERVGRRSHREPSSMVPPRTRDVGKVDGAALQGARPEPARRIKRGESATADASGVALTLELPERPSSAPRSPHLPPQAPDEAKASQIGWLARASQYAFGSPYADSEEDDDEGKAEAGQGASGSGREAAGDVDFTADRAPSSTRQRRRKQRS